MKILRLDKYPVARDTDQESEFENWPKIRTIGGIIPIQKTNINYLAQMAEPLRSNG